MDPVPSQKSQAPTRKAPATITATPNPVPTGISYGTTMISWDTGSGEPGEVYVDVAGKPEMLFAEGASGTMPAPWIGPGSTYVFRLYRTGVRSKPLALVAVIPRPGGVLATSSGRPTLEAKPNPVPRVSGYGKTLIQWTTGDGSHGEVWVSTNGRPEERFAEGGDGSSEAAWIGQGIYTFTLYAGKAHKVVLANLVVKQEGEQARQ